jgi:predicted CDP-diglyceride synthetase/phosphatidate cytidylyltransferase
MSRASIHFRQQVFKVTAWYDLAVRLSAFQVITLSALIVFIAISIFLIFFSIRYPRNLPLVREKIGKTRFSLKTRLAYYTDCGNLYRDAYENVRLLSPFITYLVLIRPAVLKKRKDVFST